MLKDLLKDLREKRGLMQKDVANELKISRQVYNNYELGKREPDYDMLARIADYYEVTTDYLLGIEKPAHQTNFPAQLLIPDILKETKVAFHKGEEGFTQEEIDRIAEFARFIKSEGKKSGGEAGKAQL